MRDRQRPRHLVAACVATLALLPLLAACGSGLGPGVPTSRPTEPPDQAPLYVSMGDSYAAGYQPDGHGGGSTTRDGFADQVVDQARAAGQELTLVNYACAGVTSTTMVDDPGCEAAALAPGAPPYPTEAQAVAALALLDRRADDVSLVTVAIGGNDLIPCLTEAAPQTCVETRVPVLRRNLDRLLTEIRARVGDTVPVVGVTYPDVFLGLYLKGDKTSLDTARRSLQLFRTYLNPVLAQAYAAHGASFVDVTALTGAYGPLDATQDLAPYGTIPTPVARVCALTWFCSQGDVHANREGYALIATAVRQAARR